MKADHQPSPSPEPVPERIPFLELGDAPLPPPARPASEPPPLIPVPPPLVPSPPPRTRERWSLLPRPLPRGPLALLFISLLMLLLLLPQALLILRIIVVEVLIYLRVLMIPLLALGIGIYLLRIFYPRRRP